MRFKNPLGGVSLSVDALSAPFGKFTDVCRMIKIEHSVFALPYAWAGAVLAAAGLSLVIGGSRSTRRLASA